MLNTTAESWGNYGPKAASNTSQPTETLSSKGQIVFSQKHGERLSSKFLCYFLLSKWPCKRRVVSTLAVHGIRSIIREQWGRYAVRDMCLYCADKTEKGGGSWVTTRMGTGTHPLRLHSPPLLSFSPLSRMSGLEAWASPQLQPQCAVWPRAWPMLFYISVFHLEWKYLPTPDLQQY